MDSRATRRRRKILADGGSQLSILIGQEATSAHYELQERTGETKTRIIERLLITAQAGIPAGRIT